jgi:hypothetical protein
MRFGAVHETPKWTCYQQNKNSVKVDGKIAPPSFTQNDSVVSIYWLRKNDALGRTYRM